uniref:Uncharacterized protein n=1 Tax=Oncorhynchus tshawytscha TaxID=74940 RepID=A0AAZ3R7B0_ONCTS
MRTLHRLKLMSSPSLSDLGKSDKAALEERGTQQRKAGANATWNRYCSRDSVCVCHPALLNRRYCSLDSLCVCVFSVSVSEQEVL